MAAGACCECTSRTRLAIDVFICEKPLRRSQHLEFKTWKSFRSIATLIQDCSMEWWIRKTGLLKINGYYYSKFQYQNYRFSFRNMFRTVIFLIFQPPFPSLIGLSHAFIRLLTLLYPAKRLTLLLKNTAAGRGSAQGPGLLPLVALATLQDRIQLFRPAEQLPIWTHGLSSERQRHFPGRASRTQHVFEQVLCWKCASGVF